MNWQLTLMCHNHLMLYLASVCNYFIFYGNLGLVTQVVQLSNAISCNNKED